MSLAKLNVTKNKKINGGSMKKLMVSLMLIISMFAFAAESAPSATVGYVKYDCVAPSSGYNMISLPVDQGFSMSNVVADAIPSCNQISYYDAAIQGWIASDPALFGGWNNTFSVQTGMGLQVNVTAASQFINNGPVVDIPAYNLVAPSTGYNVIMHPLTMASFTTSDLIADDISNCNQISYYDAAIQGWVASDPALFGGWNNTFATEIGKGLMVNVTAGSTWPGTKSDEVVNGQVPTQPKGNIKNVYYKVVDFEGNAFDFSTAPYDNVTFKAWIVGRDTELLQEFSAGSQWAMQGAYSTVAVQIGNFPTSWSLGEVVRFWVKQEDGVAAPNQQTLYEGYGDSAPLTIDATAYEGFVDEGIGTTNEIHVATTPSSINEMVPVETKLHQNYPNPFNPTTTIKFDLSSDSVVKLNVYNYNGQMVKSLVDGTMNAGIHTVEFDASDLCAGVYYYTMEAGNSVMSNKMVLVK